MEWLQQFTPRVGWADHTLVERDGVLAAKATIALGADVIEHLFNVLDPYEMKDGPVLITLELVSELREFADQSKDEQLEAIKSELAEKGVGLKTLEGYQRRELTHQEVLNSDYYRGWFASYDSGTKS